jgi:hypothetical protein
VNIEARFVPVEQWPGEKRPPHKRINSPFGAKWARTLLDMDRELRHLRARDVLVQAYFRSGQVRLDGCPLSNAAPSEPGVILSFDTPTGPLSFPCDTYKTWQDNFRAIALGLAALRAVERYGVTRHQEQYKGWAKLPPAPKNMAPADALQFFSLHSDVRPLNANTFKSAYRTAAARLHPDNQQTGNEHLFRLLTEAKETLEASYGWS